MAFAFWSQLIRLLPSYVRPVEPPEGESKLVVIVGDIPECK